MNVVIASKNNGTEVFRCDTGFKYGEGSRNEEEQARAITDALVADGYKCSTYIAQNPNEILKD